jgi:hypothetical protein
MKLLDMLSGNILEGAAGLVKTIFGDKEKEAQFRLEVQKLLQAELSEVESTLRTTIQARERVLVAELNQSDLFTKRARPSVVYFGLLLIGFNYCLVPLVTLFMPSVGLTTLVLPTEFWMAWGGLVATWSIGRTKEKQGIATKAVSIITGNKSVVTEEIKTAQALKAPLWEDGD